MESDQTIMEWSHVMEWGQTRPTITEWSQTRPMEWSQTRPMEWSQIRPYGMESDQTVWNGVSLNQESE